MLYKETSNGDSHHMVCVKDKNGTYQHFDIPWEVYLYIKQLEACIRFPEESKLPEFYSDRFGEQKEE